jgi:hypothetical protein
MAKDPVTREIRPRLIRRNIGGWLAVSPLNCGLCIGVDAPTEGEALIRFRSAFTRWLEILSLNDRKTLDVPN